MSDDSQKNNPSHGPVAQVTMAPLTIMYSLTFSDSTSSNPRRKSERIKRIVEVNYQEQTEKMISGKSAFCLHFQIFSKI